MEEESRNPSEGSSGGVPETIGRCTECGDVYVVQGENDDFRPIGTTGTCECGNDEFEPITDR